jgi:FKBP-type peptidyl-prolyl cis-trans isomerase FkpA
MQEGFLFMKKYIICLLALTLVVKANAQTEIQRTPRGAMCQVFTRNTTPKINLNDVITFQIIQKTDKDSVLYSTYASGAPVMVQVVASKNVGDLMEVFPMLTVKDSALVKVPTDSIFVGHEDQRPPFLPKGSNLDFTIKIVRVQTLNEAIAERDSAIAAKKTAEDKLKVAEINDTKQYIADHKLVLKTTPSGLKYVITKASVKPRPLKGDTVWVNYTGRTLEDKVFDSSIESVAKEAGLNQPGRTYEPLKFVLGVDNIIPGWHEGLQLVNEGGKATLVIPSSLAYGDQGAGEDIKPYSTLVFDVELVKIHPIKHPVVKKPAAPAGKAPVKKKPAAATTH